MLTKQLRELERQAEVTQQPTKKDKIGNDIYPIEQSLTYIANSLSDFQHGLSYLRVDNNVSDETDLRGVESKLLEVADTVSDGNHALYEIDNKLESISESLKTIANGLETFIGWYIESQNKK